MIKIVCVEDEATIRDDLVEELSDQGHQVIAVGDGQAGLEAIWEHHPDMVICDFLMPRMSGGDLFQKLKDDFPGFENLPFVFLSAHADERHVQDGVKMGADAYLTKPVNFDLLIETVDGLLSRK